MWRKKGFAISETSARRAISYLEAQGLIQRHNVNGKTYWSEVTEKQRLLQSQGLDQNPAQGTIRPIPDN